MSDGYLDLSALPRELAGDDAAREARHALLASLLGAYADGELPPETASQIDAHLLGCARCRREVSVHNALRDRLMATASPATRGDELAVEALSARIANRIATIPSSSTAEPSQVRTRGNPVPDAWRGIRRQWLVLSGLVVVACVAMLLSIRVRDSRSVIAGTTMSADSIPLFSEVLRDYRRVTVGDLPGRARDLDAVRAAVPFAVEPVHAPALRLLAAWTTDLEGQSAAVLAYRWNEQLLLQYVVADESLFRASSVRTSLAQQRHVAATSAAQGVLAWAMPDAGSIVVGEIRPEQLRVLWGVVNGR